MALLRGDTVNGPNRRSQPPCFQHLGDLQNRARHSFTVEMGAHCETGCGSTLPKSFVFKLLQAPSQSAFAAHAIWRTKKAPRVADRRSRSSKDCARAPVVTLRAASASAGFAPLVAPGS